MTLAVVTDSAACLPPALAADRGIDVVTLPVLPGDDGAPATTSRPSVETLAEAYESALSRADQVLALHLTSALSGTVENARLAAAQVLGAGAGADRAASGGEERLLVLDSGVSAGALGLAALAASRRRTEVAALAMWYPALGSPRVQRTRFRSRRAVPDSYAIEVDGRAVELGARYALDVWDLDVDAELRFRQVADVALRGLDLVAAAEELADGLGLGR